MQKILSHVLGSDPVVQANTDAYYDDIAVNVTEMPVNRVLKVLQCFGLEAKDPVPIDGGRVLGLSVKVDEGGKLLPEEVTRRNYFAWTGRLVGHYPVCGWLRPACSIIKRMASDCGWDTVVEPEIADKAL